MQQARWSVLLLEILGGFTGRRPERRVGAKGMPGRVGSAEAGAWKSIGAWEEEGRVSGS